MAAFKAWASRAGMPGIHPTSSFVTVIMGAALGHEERFPPTRLSARYGFRKETIAGMRRNGRDAPIPAVRGTVMEPPESTPERPSRPRRWIAGSVGKRTYHDDRLH
jgi:hypothetical protein